MRIKSMQWALVYGSGVIVLTMGTYWIASYPRMSVECAASLAVLKDTLVQTVREELARKNDTNSHLPIIYVITPTYRRSEQIPELTRLAQTLMRVPRIYWLVAEDASVANMRVVNYLQYTALPHTYLLTPMPGKYKNHTSKPKGVANRNGAMAWVRSQATEGVIYFADDDNTYDIRVFEEMRYTKRVSMWPVGLMKNTGLSTPVLKNGQFAGWYDGWLGGRKFPVDMAGFAVSVKYLLEKPDAKMPYIPGYEEDGFLKSLGITTKDIEFKAAQCTQVYVWHTQTKKLGPFKRDILGSKYDETNLRVLEKGLILKPS